LTTIVFRKNSSEKEMFSVLVGHARSVRSVNGPLNPHAKYIGQRSLSSKAKAILTHVPH